MVASDAELAPREAGASPDQTLVERAQARTYTTLSLTTPSETSSVADETSTDADEA